MFIPIILGTAREGRSSEAVARFIHTELSKRENITTELIDVCDYLFSKTYEAWNEHAETKSWREIAGKADGFIFVLPEYNHGYPGEFKIMLDSAHGEYEKKPASICGVSSGTLGGARVIDHIKPVLTELKMHVTREAMYFTKAGELFDENGTPKDESYAKYLNTMFDELLWYADVLKQGRENK